MQLTPVLNIALVLITASILSCNTKETHTVNDGGLVLPAGFSSSIIADSLGKTRHIVVTPQNDIYVRLAQLKDGHGTLLLHQENSKAKLVYGFGNYMGTGIGLKNGYLYTASDSEIFRYKVDANNQVTDTAHPERIVKSLVAGAEHNTKSIMFDGSGNMYIPVGCPSNSCQEHDRQTGSMGVKGCPLLQTAGGVWMFSPDKKDQTYADGVRYATGLRNVVAVDWNYQSNKLFVMQHGRDQLNTIFPALYNAKQNAQLPAECMYALSKGADAGWPYIYFDPFKNKKMLAPEYGGDGIKTIDTAYINPAVAFPAHMAPDGLLFYTGDMFPEKYKNGTFIAFHGSWNRSPEPQAGYFVVFQPFKNGEPAGDWEVFADNFSGSPDSTASGHAQHRPCGLAQGPDGALYVTDDVRGTIFKITYNKNDLERDQSNPAPNNFRDKPADNINATTININGNMAAGKSVYAANCATCHQVDGKGTSSMIPPLSGTSYVAGDKVKLVTAVLKGVSKQDIDGKSYSNVMPPFAQLSDRDIANVLTYVRSSFGNIASAIITDDVKKVRATFGHK
jgi:glucose/arabinose dehydrogenase/mono/diheme cytochrome c family protein